MRVAVTGGAGFIGSHLVDRLRADGHRVLILDNFSTGSIANVLERNTLDADLQVSLSDVAMEHLIMSRLFHYDPDVIVHAAASYADPDKWERDVLVNTLGTVHVASVARTLRARVIYLQTALCYGTRPVSTPIPLDHPLAPDSSYAISKTAGEAYLRASGIDFVSFRLANVYGPRNLSGPLPAFYRRLVAGESCHVADTRRDFVYIDDLMRAVMPAVEGHGSGIYHLSSGHDVAIKDLYETVSAALGIPMIAELQPRSPGDAPTILLDPSRAHTDFDWKTTTPLFDGVNAAMVWYREHGVTTSYTHLRVD